ncbi:MAG: tRNA (adenosine(37)-N6)-threonylcarbamoyltransferase complex ATPase subunit type 1 TsaE [Candidatus Omnitrophota bacterium]|jgi:tRNA threonylcarbamoyladenosine biosynthesis protein TsaE|nr:MAG: tRNA (adenosine(37)-N6)-threonylcarbamoyltransferase complex ATPase subunit type 1 TsaE [Candidatus Omnitrophota bacterium]
MIFVSHSERQTRMLAKKIAALLKLGDIICLTGDLGSGKTVFTKGIAWGLGIAPEKIVSPTFVLLRQYEQSRIPLFHFDLYRVAHSRQISEVGYEEYMFDAGVTVVEWAERLGVLMPESYLKISLRIVSDKSRALTFTARGNRYSALLRQLHAIIKP